MLDLPTTHSITQIMKSSTDMLRPVLLTIQRLQKLNHYLQQSLDDSLRNYCKAVELQNGCLVIAAENSSIGTLLRYQTSDLLSKLRTIKGLHGLASIKVVVRPMSELIFETNKVPEIERILPKQAGEMLENLASTVDDQELRQALMSLAKRADF